MNIHPVRAVGVFPEFHPELSVALPPDYDVDDVHANVLGQAAVFPVDPFHSCRSTSPFSREGPSVDGMPLEHTQQIDDDTLDNMVARYFDSDVDGAGTEVDMISVDEITYNSTQHAGRNQVLMDEVDVSLSSACNSPYLNTRNAGMDYNKAAERKKRGIQKGKRSRAPARPWTEDEHQRFEESLELFGRNWEQCAAYIGTRRAQLVRSHAQKHLIKLWKLGKPLPKKVAESGTGYTLSGKPLLADSASARSYLTKIPCPDSEKSDGSTE